MRQEHLLAALDPDIRAVGAVVPEHEPIQTPFDRAMVARGLGIRNHQIAAAVASQQNGVIFEVLQDAAPLIDETQAGIRQRWRSGAAAEVRYVRAMPPDELAEAELLGLAFQPDGIKAPGRAADKRRKPGCRVVRREDLAFG